MPLGSVGKCSFPNSTQDSPLCSRLTPSDETVMIPPGWVQLYRGVSKSWQNFETPLPPRLLLCGMPGFPSD